MISPKPCKNKSLCIEYNRLYILQYFLEDAKEFKMHESRSSPLNSKVILGPQLIHVASHEGWSCGPTTFAPPLTTCHVSKLQQKLWS